MRRILIATIGYSGYLTIQTAQSLDQAKDEARASGWEARTLLLSGSADIADMRNQVLGLFLNTVCDNLLFVDADVSWGAGTISHIMGHHVDVVAGIYRERSDENTVYPVCWTIHHKTWIDHDTGVPLLRAAAVPAGFLRLSRHCVETLANRKETRWVRNDRKLRGISYPFLFDWTWREADGIWERKSEDFTFCQLWRDAGGEVWIDPALKINHIGQKVFAGDFMCHLRDDMLTSVNMANPKEVAMAALALAGAA